MSNYANITKQNDVTGSDLYRFEDSAVPRLYRPTILHTVAENQAKTSMTVTIKSLSPVVREVSGLSTSTDSFLMVTKFTALQHISNDVQRAKAFDDHLAFLSAARASILEGRLPAEAITLEGIAVQ